MQSLKYTIELYDEQGTLSLGHKQNIYYKSFFHHSTHMTIQVGSTEVTLIPHIIMSTNATTSQELHRCQSTTHRIIRLDNS